MRKSTVFRIAKNLVTVAPVDGKWAVMVNGATRWLARTLVDDRVYWIVVL